MALTRLGERIVIVGPSCSGKSTLGAAIANRCSLPCVELDALYWKPNWQPTPDAEFVESLRSAIEGGRWVVVGNYFRLCSALVWPRAQTIIWLDMPLWRTVPRILLRSWRRVQSRELLWGTNYERFWSQLKLWDPDASLIAYSARSRAPHRRFVQAAMTDLKLKHVQFLQLRNQRETEALLQ